MTTEQRRKVIIITVIAAVALAGIISYRIYASLAANKERAAKASQTRSVAVETGAVVRSDITPVISLSANLEPTWSADISAKVDGRIDSLLVEEGDLVRAGGVIATLDNSELAAQVVQAQGSLYSAQASLEQARLDLSRMEALAAQGAVSAQSLDTARIKRDMAYGQVRAAEGNLSLLQTRLNNASVVAPRDGIVVKRHLQSGYYAKAGSPIVTVADVTSLLAKATVGEGQVGEISVGSTVTVLVNALGNKPFTGKVTKLSPAAALPARTFTAEITVANPDGVLKPGMFARVELTGQVRKNALVVPEGALALREDQKIVYVVTADNKAQQRVLRLGYVGGGLAEVLDGVKEGEKIIVAGHNKIKDGAAIDGPAGAGDR